MFKIAYQIKLETWSKSPEALACYERMRANEINPAAMYASQYTQKVLSVNQVDNYYLAQKIEKALRRVADKISIGVENSFAVCYTDLLVACPAQHIEEAFSSIQEFISLLLDQKVYFHSFTFFVENTNAEIAL